eukprot:4339018-Pyramimonas_sp.AAC.1
MTWIEFYELYRCEVLEVDRDDYDSAGFKAFKKAYHDKWQHMLGFRDLGQHDRCDTCVELTKWRREHPDAQQRKAADTAYRAHLNRMFDDRRLDARLSHLSELSCSATSSISSVLHIRIDGMDQSKFKVPRNVESAKMWSSSWRPTLHVVGVVVEGLMECFYIMPPDEQKGSDMEATIVSR